VAGALHRGDAGCAVPGQLWLPGDVRVISKARRPEADAYSGFQGTDLSRQLRESGCRRVFVGGLATEYCVRATVLDARACGLAVVVLADAIRAIDAQEGERALAEMIAAGVASGQIRFSGVLEDAFPGGIA